MHISLVSFKYRLILTTNNNSITIEERSKLFASQLLITKKAISF